MSTPEKFISQEISNYEHQLQAVSTLKQKVKEAQAELEASYSGLIGVKSEFENIKKQNIEELRLYKLTVLRECNEITTTFKALKATTAQVSSTELSSLVASLGALSALNASGFFDRFVIKS